MSFKLTENEVYKYLGLAVIILAVIFIIHKIVEIQSRVIEGMTNNDPHGKSINELIDEIKKVAQNKRNDLHITEDREKLEDIIFSYKSIIGCDVLKDMSTNRDNENNSELLMNKLVGYNNSMDGLDKLMNQLDRFENRVKKDKSSW
tara:strand:+ start:1777 stop:2214 length:438 start_codon:yes stop_codon:yes gene_type:complete